MAYVETLLQKLGDMDLSEGGLYMINVDHEPWCHLLAGVNAIADRKSRFNETMHRKVFNEKIL